jgi:glucose-1-phosphate thymidylyltransferase
MVFEPAGAPDMKGIILAGGSGTRLYPLTTSISKQLLPIYDKPMIYYPLSILMLANIKDILIISTPHDLPKFQDLLKDGSQLGINISYEPQPSPNGIAESFLIGEKFINNEPVCLILGDNIFYGHGLSTLLQTASQLKTGGLIFGYLVQDPQRYGVINFDSKGNVKKIEEKPQHPKSHYAITGLYFYDSQVVKLAKTLRPSKRNEIEITDLNKLYMSQNQLKVELLGRGITWLDTGTYDSLMQASNFVQTIQQRQSLKIACIEEIAFHNKWIDKQQLKISGQKMKSNEYGQYLLQLVNGII